MRQSHQASGGQVDGDAYDRPTGAGCERGKACSTSEGNRVSYPIDDAAVVVLDWS